MGDVDWEWRGRGTGRKGVVRNLRGRVGWVGGGGRLQMEMVPEWSKNVKGQKSHGRELSASSHLQAETSESCNHHQGPRELIRSSIIIIIIIIHLSSILVLYTTTTQFNMQCTRRLLAPPGFWKRSLQELSRLSSIGPSHRIRPQLHS